MLKGGILMLPSSLQAVLEKAADRLKDQPHLLETFQNAFVSTIDTTWKQLPDGESFVITGDIPAMWLRDSSAQVRHYLPFVKEDEELRKLIH